MIRRVIRSNFGSPIRPLEESAAFPVVAIQPILDALDPRPRVVSTRVKTIDDGLRLLIVEMFEQMRDIFGFRLTVS